ncbi:MAG: hypothetical protein QOG79_6849 [Mycobacterium sp.]|jgi:hypothetical protein|nr:hypothetical protein [Mycobacterium sp.]MDT5303527.1 hypothetical protein [Mycobacterium sp.]MDT5319716.1 hypothetical protein [Mycobacterium sp.]
MNTNTANNDGPYARKPAHGPSRRADPANDSHAAP